MIFNMFKHVKEKAGNENVLNS